MGAVPELCKNGDFKLFILIAVLYIRFRPSDRVLDRNILILFRPLTTGTMPLTTQILHTATNDAHLRK